MQVIQQAFSHSSSSFMIGKIQGNIVDILYAPLTPGEVTIAINLAACTRSLIIACTSIIVFNLIVDLEFYSFFYIFIFTFLGSFILSSIGIIIGLWAEKFDHMASATNFIIVPLSFLSGTFYSIQRLPNILKEISELNPFFYVIDGFRYGFLGVSDVLPYKSLIILLTCNFFLGYLAWYILKVGYRLKT